MEPTKYTETTLEGGGVSGYSGKGKTELIAMLEASESQPLPS